MPKRFESQSKKESADAPLDIREKVKAALKGMGLVAAGIAAFEIGASLGTGEKKERYPDRDISPPSKQRVIPKHAYERPTDQQIGAMLEILQSSVKKEHGDTTLKSSDSPEEATESGEAPLAHDADWYREMASLNPDELLIHSLGALKDLKRNEARNILAILNQTVGRDSDTTKRFFESLPAIHALGMYTEKEYDGFSHVVADTHPEMYLHYLRKHEIAMYLPQDPESIVRAMEQDPTFLIKQGSSQEGMGMDLMTPFMHEALKTEGGDFIRETYIMLADPKSEEYKKYTIYQKEDIAMFLPLIRDGRMTFDEAAELRHRVEHGDVGRFGLFSNTAYWEQVIEAGETGALARKEVERLAYRLLNAEHDDKRGGVRAVPTDELLHDIVTRFSVRALEKIITHGEAGGAQQGQRGYDTLLRGLQEKMSTEGKSWKDSLQEISSGEGLRLMAIAAQTGRLGEILHDVGADTEERLVNAWFEEVKNTPSSATPDLAAVLADMKDDSLSGLAKNHIERLYANAKTKEMRGVAALLARVVQDVHPDPEGSPFQKIAAEGVDISTRT